MKINYRRILIISLSLMIFLPVVAFAAGLIPCGNVTLLADGTIDPKGGHMCTFADFSSLINEALKWFIRISVLVAAVTFSIAGAKILLNPGKPDQITQGWAMFRKTVIGLIIVLCAWLVIHTVIVALVPNSTAPGGALQFLDK